MSILEYLLTLLHARFIGSVLIDESGDQVVIEKRFFGEQFLDYVNGIFFLPSILGDWAERGGRFASGPLIIKQNSVRAYSLLPCENTQKYSRLLQESTPKYSILLQGSTPKYSLLPCESTQKYSIILRESTPKYSKEVLQSTPDHTKYSKVLRGITPKYSRRY